MKDHSHCFKQSLLILVLLFLSSCLEKPQSREEETSTGREDSMTSDIQTPIEDTGPAGLDMSDIAPRDQMLGDLDLDMTTTVDASTSLNCSIVCVALNEQISDSQCSFLSLDIELCESYCDQTGLEDFARSIRENPEDDQSELNCSLLVQHMYSCTDKCAAISECAGSLRTNCSPITETSCVETCEENPEVFLNFGPNEAHCDYFESQINEPFCSECARKCETLRDCSNEMSIICPDVITSQCTSLCLQNPLEFEAENLCNYFRMNTNSQSCGHCAASSSMSESLSYGFYVRARARPENQEVTEQVRFSRARFTVCQHLIDDNHDCDYYFNLGENRFSMKLSPNIPINATSNPSRLAYRARLELHLEGIVRADTQNSPITVHLIPEINTEDPGNSGLNMSQSDWLGDSFFGQNPTTVHDASRFTTTFAVRQAYFNNSGTDEWKLEFRGLSQIERFTLLFDHLSLRAPQDHNRACLAYPGCLPIDVDSFCNELCDYRNGLIGCVDSSSCALSVDQATMEIGHLDNACQNQGQCKAQCEADICDLAYHIDYRRDLDGDVTHLGFTDWHTNEESSVSDMDDLDCCLCGAPHCEAFNVALTCPF